MNPEMPEDSLPPAETPQTPPPEGQLNAPPAGLDYEVLRLIGRGAYGEVWLVRDKLGEYLACKVIYRVSFDHDRPYEREYDGIKKFEPVSRGNESQVKVVHVGRRDHAGYFYYLMELADDANSGRAIDPERYVPKTLKSELRRRGRLPIPECIHIGLSLSATLENLHRHGLIHRDIKPGNIIFVNGIPKLADIGLVTEADVSISYVGTEGYIPQEGPTSPLADIYGLGKVLYEISTGRDRQDFPELPTDLAELPDRQARLEFNAVVTKACQIAPRRRYQSAQALHADLALLQSGGSVRRWRRQRKQWTVALALGSALLLGWLVVAGFARFRHHQRQADPGRPAANIAAAKIPVPQAAELNRAESSLRERLKDQLASAGTEAKYRLAGELLQQAAYSEEPATEFASLRLAADLAGEAEEFALAMDACAKMGSRFAVAVLPAKLRLLSAAPSLAHTYKGNASLTAACLATGFEAVALDDYDRAATLLELGRSAANRSSQPHWQRQVEFFAAELLRCRREYDQLKDSVHTLRDNPGDPAANLALGRFLCFVKNDWETGLPMMAHGNDDRLRAVLEREISRPPVKPAEQLALADLWWDLAAPAPESLKLPCRQRARYWYLKAIARSKAPEKPALKEKVADRIKAVPPPSGEVRIFARVDRTDYIALFSDQIRWTSTRGSFKAQINHVLLGNLKPREQRVIKNSGATRLFPEGVDFSTAQLTINHKGKRRGKASLERAEDHVRVVLMDQFAGASDLEVTVTFATPP